MAGASDDLVDEPSCCWTASAGAAPPGRGRLGTRVDAPHRRDAPPDAAACERFATGGAFRSWAYLFQSPRGGRNTVISTVIVPRRRCARAIAAESPRWRRSVGRHGRMARRRDRRMARPGRLPLCRNHARGMKAAIWLLLLQALLGAFDTLYYHEYRLKLAQSARTGVELRLHAARDFAYAIIIGSLGFLTWHGVFAWILLLLLLSEIGITLWDFIEEDRIRRLPAWMLLVLAAGVLASGIRDLIASTRPVAA